MICNNGERCAACPSLQEGGWDGKGNTVAQIWGNGPTDCGIMFVGEAPGIEENNKRQIYSGYTGREFNEHYIKLAGFDRPHVYFTNTIKCMTPFTWAKVDDNVRSTCASWHLAEEIRHVQPKVVVLMGATACKLVPELDLEMHHGFPFESVDLFGHRCTVWPCYHPSFGAHDTGAMETIREDFRRLRLYLDGHLQLPVNSHPYPLYMELTDPEEVDALIGGPYEPLATDTEWDTESPDNDPFCLTFSAREGTGFLIRADNEPVLQRYREYVSDDLAATRDLGQRVYTSKRALQYMEERLRLPRRGPLIIHSMMADIPVYEKLGIYIARAHRRVIDTMTMSYHLQNKPQALKQLAWRECGLKMKEYDDVVFPHSIKRAVEYVQFIQTRDWPKPEPDVELQPDGSYKLKKPQGLNTKLKRMMTDFRKAEAAGDRSAMKDTVWKRWRSWSEHERKPAIQEFGPMPLMSIKHVPIEEVVDYACPDADATLRVYNKLRREKVTIKGLARLEYLDYTRRM